MKIAGAIIAKLKNEHPGMNAVQLKERARQLFCLQAISLAGDDPMAAGKLWLKLNRRMGM
jgi:hypothetical protein